MQNAFEGVFYNEVHNIFLKKRPNEEQECLYRVAVLLSKGHSGKALTIKLTDDSDYTFLFSLVLTQEDFIVLKNEQGLRVDFENFPRQFTKLLADCKSTGKSQFSITLEDSDGNSCPSQSFSHSGLFLKIIEQNEFKYLCHLSLRIAPGTDEDVKQHLCHKLKSAEDQLVNERKKSCQLEAELERNENLLSANARKLNDLEMKLLEERNIVKLEANQQLTEEREKHSQHLRMVEEKHENTVQELKSSIGLLTHKNTMCHDAKSSLESNVRELTVRNEAYERDCARLSSENSALKESTRTLELKLLDVEQLLGSTTRKLNAVEDSTKELTGLLTQARRDAQIARDRESSLVHKIRHIEGQLQHTSSQLSQSKQENTRLEEELFTKRKTLANLVNVARDLEEKLMGLKSELASKTELLEEAKKKTTDLSKNVDELNNKLIEANEKLKEQEQTIKRQDDVNSYLHRKLNESGVAQNNNASLKSTSFATSLIAKNIPSMAANSTSITQSKNVSLPPWLTEEADKDLSENMKNNSKNRLGLDPSYLVPDTVSNSKETRAHQPNSAFFTQLSSRKPTS